MKYLEISKDLKLRELNERVGSRNTPYILAANDLNRVPPIGKAYYEKCDEKLKLDREKRKADENYKGVPWQKKATILNNLVDNSDIFEIAALQSEDDWVILEAMNTLPGTLLIPDGIVVTSGSDLLGNETPVSKAVYNSVMKDIATYPHIVNPEIFNEYSAIRNVQIITMEDHSSDVFQWFRLPWGEVSLYSSISGTMMDFPVYPESYQDSKQANYTTMPDLLYNYEPWVVYQGSGPRSNTFLFKMHRDMWTGNHNDGKCNELIRFCEANCYPEYVGSAVYTPTVTLYIGGKSIITGVMTNVEKAFSGPLGHDNFYLYVELSITIQEVADTSLSYSTIMNKPLIG